MLNFAKFFWILALKLYIRHMKIALIGYGKMGKMIEQIARDRGHEIVSIIDIDNQADFEVGD